MKAKRLTSSSSPRVLCFSLLYSFVKEKIILCHVLKAEPSPCCSRSSILRVAMSFYSKSLGRNKSCHVLKAKVLPASSSSLRIGMHVYSNSLGRNKSCHGLKAKFLSACSSLSRVAIPVYNNASGRNKSCVILKVKPSPACSSLPPSRYGCFFLV